ncbi:MAG: metallophosphoesterase [Deltaproteobacteria bacterium]|nr:metallophosphoesterase [Deltaproteobacteria bacterium]MBW2179061.1 metallophosphoesterase [Deltaproteobacteria bacterium]MBW2364029.1 metallophosphoesterase [Deltaproteobacteria bacterium]
MCQSRKRVNVYYSFLFLVPKDTFCSIENILNTVKILYTTDIHASPDHLFSMLSIAKNEGVDSIIVGGDLIPHHLPDERQSNILKAQAKYLKDIFVPAIMNFREQKDICIYLDMANDDYICNRDILQEHNNDLFHLLHMEKHHLTDTVDIVGYMVVPPTPFNRKDWEKPDTPEFPFSPGNQVQLSGHISSNGILEKAVIDLNSSDTIERDHHQLSEIIDKPFIFVSHTPPYRTPLDVIYNGLHVGSLSVRHFIEKWSKAGKIIASLHGHIHESPGRSGEISTKINNVLCINPGQESGRSSKFRYVILQLTGAFSSGIEILKTEAGACVK